MGVPRVGGGVALRTCQAAATVIFPQDKSDGLGELGSSPQFLRSSPDSFLRLPAQALS